MNKYYSVKAACLWLAIALLLPVAAHAQGTAVGTNAASTNMIPRPPIQRTPPINGYVIAVDTNAMTLAIGNSVFTVGPKTRISKANKAAALSDIKVGDYAVVIYVKAPNGSLNALGIRIRPHPAVKARQTTSATTATPAAPATH